MDPIIFFFIAFGIGLMLTSVRVWRLASRERASQSWPLVMGEILRSEVARERRSVAGSRHTIFVPDVAYAYSLFGVRYEGNTVAFGGYIYTSSPDRAERKCQEYPVGKEVVVFYDPRDPATSSLERTPGSPLPGYLAAVLLGAAGIGLLGFLIAG